VGAGGAASTEAARRRALGHRAGVLPGRWAPGQAEAYARRWGYSELVFLAGSRKNQKEQGKDEASQVQKEAAKKAPHRKGHR
jgi:hypothetical protein